MIPHLRPTRKAPPFDTSSPMMPARRATLNTSKVRLLSSESVRQTQPKSVVEQEEGVVVFMAQLVGRLLHQEGLTPCPPKRRAFRQVRPPPAPAPDAGGPGSGWAKGERGHGDRARAPSPPARAGARGHSTPTPKLISQRGSTLRSTTAKSRCCWWRMASKLSSGPTPP